MILILNVFICSVCDLDFTGFRQIKVIVPNVQQVAPAVHVGFYTVTGVPRLFLWGGRERRGGYALSKRKEIIFNT